MAQTSLTTGWLDVKGAAKHCSVSTAIIYAAVNSGDLPAVRMSTETSPLRIKVADLDAWMDAKPDAAALR